MYKYRKLYEQFKKEVVNAISSNKGLFLAGPKLFDFFKQIKKTENELTSALLMIFTLGMEVGGILVREELEKRNKQQTAGEVIFEAKPDKK